MKTMGETTSPMVAPTTPEPRARALPGSLFGRLSAALLAAVAACGSGERPSNLVVVVADTLRADYLGCYGFGNGVSPHLDQLATESVVFDRCFTQAPWTKPATASLLTSLYPETHGLTDHEGGFWSDSPERRAGVLPASATTLAEALAASGYRTAGFTANSWLVRSYGFAQGFEMYDDFAARLDTHADEILDNARRWLEHSDPRQPFFLYLHFMDVHAPYDGSKSDYERLSGLPELQADRPLSDTEVPFNRWQNIDRKPSWVSEGERHRLAYWRTRYASGVRALDRRLDAFVHELRLSGRLDDTVFVLTSDHGEHLFEHGDWSHGQNLYDHQLRIPLIIRDAGGRGGGRRVEEVVELVDVMPTVLALLRLPIPPGLEGRDLSPAFQGGELDADRASFATAVQRRPGMRSVRTGSHKLIVDLDTDETWLFDLRTDPTEQFDLAEREPDEVRALRARLDDHIAALAERGAIPVEDVVIPEDELRRLEALGYQ